MLSALKRYRWLKSVLRIALGFIFLWAFFDKLFGLGFATPSNKAWLNGCSPTSGFLTYATQGPFADFYHLLANQAAIDWLFMVGLLLIGLGLVTGIMVRLACYGAILLMATLWSALLWPENNPFVDEHVIYALVLFGLSRTDVTQQLGLGKWWQSLPLVQRYPTLR